MKPNPVAEFVVVDDNGPRCGDCGGSVKSERVTLPGTVFRQKLAYRHLRPDCVQKPS